MTAIVRDNVDENRRRILLVATTAAGAAVAGGVAAPLLVSWFPSAKALAAGAPVQADVSKLEPGQQITVEWRGKPVWILKRTPEMLASLKQVEPLLADPASRVADQQPRYAQNDVRSIKPDLLVLVGICTHLGCSPDKRLAAGPASGLGDDWLGGFFCPCHGSKFDLAGRVYQNVPAPTNLIVPPHSFLSDNRILIGVDQKGAA